jgi:outer membrane protein OmpA-like peptidoglycan-associated protein
MLAQKKSAKKLGMFSFNASLSDYTFLKTVKDSSFTNAIKQKGWLKAANKSIGLGLSYWKGLTAHIDFSGTFTGTLSSFPVKFVKGDTVGQANFSSQVDALLHFKLLKDKASVNPFLTAGIGAGNFPNQFAAYAPVGIGIQLHFNDGAYIIIQAQDRIALTDGISNDYAMYSIGFAQKGKKRSTKKEIKKPIPAVDSKPAVVDTDGDGVADAKDNCPAEKGELAGCPDSDGDGVADKDDKCKNVKGLVKYGGCPVPDTDKDGINDEEDKCPLVAGVKENNGCPAGIKAVVKAKVDMAARNIFFEFASATIQERSFASLDEVVALLKENPSMKLKVEAHADNKGSFSRNFYWSEQRAKAVADYFIAKGIAAERISFKGYGDTQPIADNNTEEGRAKNRRVELIVHY